jgi:lipopolysaccharide biosynthesis glycosyltransferase
MTNLMIGTPMYGGNCTAYYTFSNLNLVRVANDNGIKLNYQFTTAESLITRARNNIADVFMNSDCSHLLFIDADIVFNPHDVIKLLNHDMDVVCGGYPAKLIDWNSVKQASDSGVPAEGLSSYASPYVYNRVNNNPQSGDLIEVKESGTGFMMIKRRVFEDLSNHVNTYMSNQFDNAGKVNKEYFSTMIEDNILISEDYFFCRKWRSIGGRVFVDKTIQLSHVGTYMYQPSPSHWVS